MATSQDFVNWVCSESLDYRYLKYILQAEMVALRRFSYGTTHQTIYFPEVKAFHACLPPVSEQHRIADLLGSLDDKIELNRRMNETLEAMARALFQSWFVDFDPVRVKARGGDPFVELGISAEVAGLFPEAFEESELGEIPKGWRASTVDQEFALTMGQSPPGETYNSVGNGLPFFQGKTDFGFRFPKNRIYCSAPTRLAKPNDTLG